MSTFLDAARAAAEGLSHPHNLALNYLCNMAQGHQNAKTGRQIAQVVTSATGKPYTAHRFQTKVVKPSRRSEAGHFIGMSHEGFFIIMDARDAAISALWYQNRIAAEWTNQDNLLSQSACNGISQSEIEKELDILRKQRKWADIS